MNTCRYMEKLKKAGYARLVLRIALSLIILSLFISCGGDRIKNPEARAGVMDLSSWSFEKNGNVKLDGQWDFFWKEFIDPSKSDVTLTPVPVVVPSIWNDVQVKGKPIGGIGYGSYRIKIILPESAVGKYFSLKLRDQATAYCAFLDGRPMGSNGTVGNSPETHRGEYRHLVKSFFVDKKEMVLVFHVSNYDHQKGGLWESVLLGEEEKIQVIKNSSLSFDLFTFGAIIIMSIYHFGLYLLRRNERSTLYFGFFTLFIAVRTLFRGEMFIVTLFPGIDFHLQVAIEYLSFYWAVPIFLLFMNVLYPVEFKKIITKIMFAVTIIFSLSVMIFPMVMYTKWMMFYQLIALLEGLYIIIGLVVATFRKREGAFSAISGWIIFFLAVTNDVLYMNNVVNTGEFSPLGLFIFIFSQSFILSLRFSQAFFSVEKLSENLNKLNIANSRFVPKQILSFLNKDSIVEIQLGDHVQKKMAILFSDIRKFTSLSEGMSPEENFNFINSYLSRISPVIAGEEGFIDKYLGDGIMALFPHKSMDAVTAAVKMQKEIHLYNIHRVNQNLEPITAGIGIHAGVLMLGTVGEENRIDATVISDSVNLTSRIEGLTKIFGASIIITEDVRVEMPGDSGFSYRFLGIVRVMGKQKTIPIYEILDGSEEPAKVLKARTKEIFENGVNAYSTKDLNTAQDYFKTVIRENPEDRATKYYLNKIRFHLGHPDIEWDASEIQIK